MKFKQFLTVALLGSILWLAMSCGCPKRVLYFQDTKDGTVDTIATDPCIRIQPYDKIYILVQTRDPQLTAMFNLSYPGSNNNMNQMLNNGGGGSAGGGRRMNQQGMQNSAPYTVEADGTIKFPVMGKLHIAGMTRPELIEYITNELITRDLVKDPTVFVEYGNLKVDFLGSGGGGPVYIDKDQFSIIDALSQHGDLKITGRRDNIKVIRQEGNLKKTYTVDLRNEKKLLKSPVYYLRQNDVIYVEPLPVEQNGATVNGNTLSSIGFWTGVPSLIIGLLTLLKVWK
ncbi:MAG: polysaccharide biosynthesis/export family protein [Bacteroidales bacterium]|nr:polysaccharide biosynthesis/export family protein [Bacteroidales bacterium]